MSSSKKVSAARSVMSAAMVAVGLGVGLASTAATAQPTLRSFTAHLSIGESVQMIGALPCLAEGTIQGSGKSAPLGAVTVESKDCINPLGPFDPTRPNDNSFVFVSKPPGMAFTAENGDRVFITYSGTLLAQRQGPHRLAGSFVITGGTGIYTHAVGGGLLFGSEDISQGASASGTIRAIGSIVY